MQYAMITLFTDIFTTSNLIPLVECGANMFGISPAASCFSVNSVPFTMSPR